MVVPKICCNGRTEYARGIHCRAGKRSSKQNVERDCRSDNEAGNATRPAFVNGRAVNHKHEKESENPLDQNSLPRGKIDGKLGSTINNDIAPEQIARNQSSTDSAETLRDPVGECVRPFHMTAANEAKRYRRI